MTVVLGIRQAVADFITATAPAGVQVSPVNPSEETKVAQGAVWVDEYDFTSEWRGLGNTGGASHQRRAESGHITLMAICYREGPSSQIASDAAISRVEEILASIETAFNADVTIGGHVGWARIQRVTGLLWARGKGWTAGARIVIAAESRP